MSIGLKSIRKLAYLSLLQSAIAKECIPIIHRLEQVSSEEHLGTLAETLMEALRENPSVAKRVSATLDLVVWDSHKITMITNLRFFL